MSDLWIDLSSVAFGKRRVLSDVQLRCSAGAHVAILGPNGAGKTTLLRSIAGLVEFHGEIRLGDRSLGVLSARERARHVAYVPQRSKLDANLPVHEVVMQGRYAHQDLWGRVTRADRAAVERALEQMDLSLLRERSFLRLSGGEQRRVLLARALATEAEVVLLDEPTAFLDLAHSLALFEHLREVADSGKVVVTVLHQLSDAERWCDKTCLLSDGCMRFFGEAALPDALVREVYGVEVLRGGSASYSLPKAGA